MPRARTRPTARDTRRIERRRVAFGSGAFSATLADIGRPPGRGWNGTTLLPEAVAGLAAAGEEGASAGDRALSRSSSIDGSNSSPVPSRSAAGAGAEAAAEAVPGAELAAVAAGAAGRPISGKSPRVGNGWMGGTGRGAAPAADAPAAAA